MECGLCWVCLKTGALLLLSFAYRRWAALLILLICFFKRTHGLGCSSVRECLPTMRKDLSSIPSTAKTKQSPKEPILLWCWLSKRLVFSLLWLLFYFIFSIGDSTQNPCTELYKLSSLGSNLWLFCLSVPVYSTRMTGVCYHAWHATGIF